MIIAVDFDGTCVTHEYPKVGKNIGAEFVLKFLSDKGHTIILNTMRGDSLDTSTVKDAVKWFNDNNIPLSGINFSPHQSDWTKSSKCFAHVYIDDAALGCPLSQLPFYSSRPFVNWYEVAKRLCRPLCTPTEWVEFSERLNKVIADTITNV